jgi:hypothetical protein
MYGPANTFKSTFIRRHLLRNLPTFLIFRPNIRSKGFPFADFKRQMHRAIMSDEAPNLNAANYDISLLKEFVSMDATSVNVKHEGARIVRLQQPFYLCQNVDMFTPDIDTIKKQFPGYIQRFQFIETCQLPDYEEQISSFMASRRRERKLANKIKRKLSSSSSSSNSKNKYGCCSSIGLSAAELFEKEASKLSDNTDDDDDDDDVEEGYMSDLDDKKKSNKKQKKTKSQTKGKVNEQLFVFPDLSDSTDSD